MAYYVYIIQSEADNSFYNGFSENPSQRTMQHNTAETFSPKHLIPCKLVYGEEIPSKRDALIREKNLKKATGDRVMAVLTHPKNIVKKFL
jgi:putative endonuclease